MKIKKEEVVIFNLINKLGSVAIKTLISHSPYPAKTTKYILRRLRDKGLVKPNPNLYDMRSVFYRTEGYINEEGMAVV